MTVSEQGELRDKIAFKIRDHEVCSGADSMMGLHYDLADEILAILEIAASLRSRSHKGGSNGE